MSIPYAFGREAEKRAADHYISDGFSILARNFRYRKAEVDLIVQKDKLLVAVEVKARSSTFFGDPEIFVSQQQIKRLIMAIDAFVVNRNLDVEVRFDIIAFTVMNKQWKMNQIKDAFYPF